MDKYIITKKLVLFSTKTEFININKTEYRLQYIVSVEPENKSKYQWEIASFDNFIDAKAFLFAHLCKGEEVYSIEVPAWEKVYSMDEGTLEPFIPYNKR